MKKPKDPALLKEPAATNRGSAPDTAASTDELDLKGLEALREKLTALRSEKPCTDEGQIISIRALIAFAAFEKGIHEEVVQSLVKKYFGVSDIAEIADIDFETVRGFLVDLNVRTGVN